jgi:myo-inositol 2-dehydrogenase / D-chiro-inositol 1-dehydrogenase
LNRREFLTTGGVLLGAGAAIFESGRSAAAQGPRTGPGGSKPRHTVERPGIGAIGLRYQGSVITRQALAHGDLVAVCDVDRNVREQARASFGSMARLFEDYRELLARKDVDVVLIATPDHWHTPMLLDACRAGKDVYCEKPLTLTIDEGKLIRRVVEETGRVVQVGSWQRSDHRFRLAVELVRQGRIGALQRVDIVLGKNETGGPFQPATPPPYLNWDLWQGQTPNVPFLYERCHYTFRWWYEYSGGQMTDWGAHHIDIAEWAIDSQPVAIDGRATFPSVTDGYNVASDFHVSYRYANGVEMTVSDTGRNGILFTGSEGRLFVNRGTIEGVPVERLAADPLPRERWTLYPHDDLERPPRMGKLDAIISHMANFSDCIDSRRPPISDVASQHQSATACHLGNISMRLGRPLQWDAGREEFVGDAEANRWLRREQRSGYEFSA